MIEQVRQWLGEAGPRGAVAFTGAGISTESGIPDFRSPGGIWSQSQPVMYDDFLRSPSARHEYWRQKAISHADFEASEPNRGHQVLAEWERQGPLRGVITQNIDGLHQQAGSSEVLELHGTAREVMCLDCQHRWPAGPLVEQFLQQERVPICEQCGGRLKHATISFGQSLEEELLEEASRWCVEARLMLAMGSSLVVEPAASFPRLAQQAGARLVIINRDPTPLDSLADAVIHASIGETLGQLAVDPDA